ncbi:MAG: GNAT family N-acetyltransferase [Chloroflexota bacterium]
MAKSPAFMRPILPKEADLIVSLDQEIFGVYGGQESPDIIRARLAVFPAGCMILELVEDSTTSHIAVYITTEKWATEREPALNEDPHTSHHPQGQVLNITTLAIRLSYQNRGLGGLLLETVESIAGREDCHTVVLETARARPFYERHGYQFIGERNERGYPLYILKKKI